MSLDGIQVVLVRQLTMSSHSCSNHCCRTKGKVNCQPNWHLQLVKRTMT